MHDQVGRLISETVRFGLFDLRLQKCHRFYPRWNCFKTVVSNIYLLLSMSFGTEVGLFGISAMIWTNCATCQQLV